MKKTCITVICLLFVCFLGMTSGQAVKADEQGWDVSKYKKDATLTEDHSNPEYKWSFDTSLTYSTGDFGTPTTTDTLYWPLSIRRYFKEGDVGITLPFIYQESGNNVASLSGRPFKIGGGSGGNSRSETGIGDFLVNGHYYLLDEPTQPFDLSAFGQIKFPTADDDEGLGTGEFDETFGLEAGKKLSDLWHIYGDLYYTFIGDPSGIDLENEVAYDLGIGYHILSTTQATIFYRESTALVDDEDNPRDLILGLNHDLEDNLNVHGDLGFGLSDGSPETSFTVGMNLYYN